jgi:hypothetical protein
MQAIIKKIIVVDNPAHALTFANWLPLMWKLRTILIYRKIHGDPTNVSGQTTATPETQYTSLVGQQAKKRLLKKILTIFSTKRPKSAQSRCHDQAITTNELFRSQLTCGTSSQKASDKFAVIHRAANFLLLS